MGDGARASWWLFAATTAACALGSGCRGDEFQGTGGAGAAGGGGGGTPTIAVIVSLLDHAEEAIPEVDVVISDASGAELVYDDTGNSGVKGFDAPPGARLSVLFGYASRRFVYSVELPDADSTLSFRLPTWVTEAPPADFEVSLATCEGTCADSYDVNLSCLPSSAVTSVPFTRTFGYAGCAGSDTFDVYVIGYDPFGVPEEASQALGNTLGQDVSLPAPELVTFGQSRPVMFELDGAEEYDATRLVRVPNAVGPGFTFVRDLDDNEVTSTIRVLDVFTPNLQTVQTVRLGSEQSLWRQQSFAPYDDQVATLDVTSLKLPAVPTGLQEPDAASPIAEFALSGSGSVGDAVVIELQQSDELYWVLWAPAAESGTITLPALPAEVSNFAMVGPHTFTVVHVDGEGTEGYTPLLELGVNNPLRDPTLGDATLGSAAL